MAEENEDRPLEDEELVVAPVAPGRRFTPLTEEAIAVAVPRALDGETLEGQTAWDGTRYLSLAIPVMSFLRHIVSALGPKRTSIAPPRLCPISGVKRT